MHSPPTGSETLPEICLTHFAGQASDLPIQFQYDEESYTFKVEAPQDYPANPLSMQTQHLEQDPHMINQQFPAENVSHASPHSPYQSYGDYPSYVSVGQLESPGGYPNTLLFFDGPPLKRQDDLSSSFEDDAFSAGSVSPVSGPSPSSISPLSSSPGIRDLTSGFEHLVLPPNAQTDSLSVPPSPELLRAHNPPLQRSSSTRSAGHRPTVSQSDAFFSQYIEADLARGRVRTRANTAPSSRRHSPYPHPFVSPSEYSPSTQPSAQASPQQYLNPEAYQPDAAIPFISLAADSGYNNQPSPSPPFRQTLTIDTTNLPNVSPFMTPQFYSHTDDFPATSSTVGDESFEPNTPGDGVFVPIAKQTVTTAKTRQAAEAKRTHPQRFECDYCPERFTTKNKKDRHMDAHLGIKRYACNIEGCSKAFTSSADRKRHQEKSKHP